MKPTSVTNVKKVSRRALLKVAVNRANDVEIAVERRKIEKFS